MPDKNNRKFPRTRLRAEVKLSHPPIGEQVAHTRDISEGGAYVLADGIIAPSMGAIVDVQVQGLPGEPAPVVPMRVVRIDKDGIGLEFIEQDEQ